MLRFAIKAQRLQRLHGHSIRSLSGRCRAQRQNGREAVPVMIFITEFITCSLIGCDIAIDDAAHPGAWRR